MADVVLVDHVRRVARRRFGAFTTIGRFGRGRRGPGLEAAGCVAGAVGVVCVAGAGSGVEGGAVGGAGACAAVTVSGARSGGSGWTNGAAAGSGGCGTGRAVGVRPVADSQIPNAKANVKRATPLATHRPLRCPGMRSWLDTCVSWVPGLPSVASSLAVSSPRAVAALSGCVAVLSGVTAVVGPCTSAMEAAAILASELRLSISAIFCARSTSISFAVSSTHSPTS